MHPSCFKHSKWWLCLNEQRSRLFWSFLIPCIYKIKSQSINKVRATAGFPAVVKWPPTTASPKCCENFHMFTLYHFHPCHILVRHNHPHHQDVPFHVDGFQQENKPNNNDKKKNPRHNLTLLTFLAMLRNFATATQESKTKKEILQTHFLAVFVWRAHTPTGLGWSCLLDRPWYTLCAAGRAHANTACNPDRVTRAGRKRGRGEQRREDRKSEGMWWGGGTAQIIYFSWTFQLVSLFTGGGSGLPSARSASAWPVPSALATFSPPPRVWFRFTSGLPQLIMNKPPSGASLEVVWSTWQPCVF